MKIQKYLPLFGLLILVLSACAPSAANSQPSDGAIPASFLNVNYNWVGGNIPLALRFRTNEDPICVALKAKGNCYTILPPGKPWDPGTRGSVEYINGQLVIKVESAPYATGEVGLTDSFEVKDNNGTLLGVSCATSTNTPCDDWVGTTWKLAGS